MQPKQSLLWIAALSFALVSSGYATTSTAKSSGLTTDNKIEIGVPVGVVGAGGVVVGTVAGVKAAKAAASKSVGQLVDGNLAADDVSVANNATMVAKIDAINPSKMTLPAYVKKIQGIRDENPTLSAQDAKLSLSADDFSELKAAYLAKGGGTGLGSRPPVYDGQKAGGDMSDGVPANEASTVKPGAIRKSAKFADEDGKDLEEEKVIDRDKPVAEDGDDTSDAPDAGSTTSGGTGDGLNLSEVDASASNAESASAGQVKDLTDLKAATTASGDSGDVGDASDADDALDVL